MENYCQVSSECSKECKPEKFLSFEDLRNQTCLWMDEIATMEDIFNRQVNKVVDGEMKIWNAKHFMETSKQEIIDAGRKLAEIDKELSTCSFNLDILELFLQSLEKCSPELNPGTVDCQRFPMYQTMMGLVCVIETNKDTMEKFFEEYKDYLQAYRQKYVVTSILDYHNKTLQNISSHLDDLENTEKVIEQKINCQIKRMHAGSTNLGKL